MKALPASYAPRGKRNHSRDLHDVRLLHQSEWLDFDKWQLAFLVTAASSPRIDCRRITTQDLAFGGGTDRRKDRLVKSGACGYGEGNPLLPSIFHQDARHKCQRGLS